MSYAKLSKLLTKENKQPERQQSFSGPNDSWDIDQNDILSVLIKNNVACWSLNDNLEFLRHFASDYFHFFHKKREELWNKTQNMLNLWCSSCLNTRSEKYLLHPMCVLKLYTFVFSCSAFLCKILLCKQDFPKRNTL